MSRVERILKVMLGRESVLPKPQSRVEELLIDLKTAYESGGEGISELRTRVELLEGETEDIKQVNETQTDAINANEEENVNRYLEVYDSIGELETTVGLMETKLNSITNPVVVKGTVENKTMLPSTEESVPGWLYFVRGTDDEKSVEYVFTIDGQWDEIGDNAIDLSEYLKTAAFEAYKTEVTANLAKKVNVSDIATEEEVTAMLNEVFPES